MPKPTDYDKTHLRNLAAIGTRIDRIFKKATEEAAKIGASIKATLPDDRIFSFDDFPETKKQLDRLLQALKDSMEVTIVNGVESAWTLSNNKNNALVARIFGDNAKKLPEEQYLRYFSTNGSALDAFLQRQVQGLNLSDRVWKYTNLFKSEIELALDLGIRSGESAAIMTRSLRKYLQHPDKLFRRVRDQHGNLRLSKAAQAFHPGRGVYRSSYKNARRLAATETNIAYRTSDYLRWQQMDFVVGIEIKLSNNHTLNGVPFTDICDTLKGRYPKDFKFVGWHPHCRCHAVSVLKTEDEMAEDTQRIMAGQQPKKGSANAVEDVPAAFKDWVEEHSERIGMGGNLPYFIKDNRKRVDRILGIEPPEPKKTPLEIAKERHDARTPEDAAKIQQAWNRRTILRFEKANDDGLLPKDVRDTIRWIQDSNDLEDFEDFRKRAGLLDMAIKRHSLRNPNIIEKITAKWDIRRIEHLLPEIQSQDLKNYIQSRLPMIKAAASKGNAGLMKALHAKILSEVQTSFMHTLASRGSNLANQSPAFKVTYDRLFNAINGNDGITALRLLSDVRNQAAIITQWNLRKWKCLDNTFVFEGLDADRIIYQGKSMKASTGSIVSVPTLQQDLLRFKDKNGVTFYYTLGIEKDDIRYSAVKASKILESKPRYIRANLEEGIIFTDRPHPLDKYYQKQYKNFKRGAMYSGDPITVHSDYTGNDNGFEFSICHEVGHHIDLKIGWRGSSISQAEWKQAQIKDGDFYREYGKNSTTEDFADMISLYVTLKGKRKHEFEARYPHRVAIIKQILSSL